MARLCSSRYEREARQNGWMRIAGLDEAGRGSLFGPVVAAAVILNSRRRIVGLDDSKKLSAERREELAERIREHALAWAVAEIDAARIDAWNIYQASRQAMMAAVAQLDPLPDYMLLDAIEIDLPIEQKALIHGDARSVSIAAASILAKVERDRRMAEFDELYPQYGLGQAQGLRYTRPSGGPPPPRPVSHAPIFVRTGPRRPLLGRRSHPKPAASRTGERRPHRLAQSLDDRVQPSSPRFRPPSKPIKSRESHCYRLWHYGLLRALPLVFPAC